MAIVDYKSFGGGTHWVPDAVGPLETFEPDPDPIDIFQAERANIAEALKREARLHADAGTDAGNVVAGVLRDWAARIARGDLWR